MKPHGQVPQDVVPVALILLAAILIKNDVIEVESIWPYLIK
jgi:hypothetical protein